MDNKAGKKVRKRGNNEEPLYIPDEIITNILIRLPVKSLVRFQLVCKGWKDIISCRDFMDLHRTSSFPVILAASTATSTRGSSFKLIAVDKWWDSARKRTVIHIFPSCVPDFPYASMKPFSHSGLIVLDGSRFPEPERTFIILNPARPSSDECVKIRYSRDFQGDILAVYYHPSLEEYCALWWIRISGSSAHDPPLIQFKLLNLGSNPSFKMISYAFTHRVKPRSLKQPLLIKDRLYWMLQSKQGYSSCHSDILEFDIITEKFMVIPCPIPLSTRCWWLQTHLLDSDGILSFLLLLDSTVTIWSLKDRELQLWTTTEYTIHLDKSCIRFAYDIIAFVNGMLAFDLDGILCVCNLKEGTVKKYPKNYRGDVLFVSHQMTLPSLRKCKDKLYIDKDGKVFVSSERIEREFQAKKKSDGEPLEKPTGKRQKQIAKKTNADAESVQVLRRLTKRCRRRIQELLAYKLSHRSVIPGQAMYDFEDWVSSKLHPFTFDKLHPFPENKERIKLLITDMKAAIVASSNLGKVDKKFEPDGVVSEPDESDDEWETDEASAGSKQGE